MHGLLAQESRGLEHRIGIACLGAAAQPPIALDPVAVVDNNRAEYGHGRSAAFGGDTAKPLLGPGRLTRLG